MHFGHRPKGCFIGWTAANDKTHSSEELRSAVQSCPETKDNVRQRLLLGILDSSCGSMTIVDSVNMDLATLRHLGGRLPQSLNLH